MSAEAGASAGTVLLVDDEPQIRIVCQQALENGGYRVTAAEDGAGALHALEAERFDAAVLDIILPDTDGLELLRAIRERDRDIIVVLITGFASLDSAMEAVRLGAYEYVRKPFHARDLVRILDRGIESRSLRGQNDELLAELRLANEELVHQQEQLRERMRIATDELAAFVELGQRLSEGGGLTETLQSILQAGVQITRARAGAAYRFEPEAGLLRGVIGVGLPAGDVVRARLRLDEGMLGRVVARGVAQIENDVLAGPVADDEYLGFLGVQSVLATPLVWEDEALGVLALFDQESGGFSDDSLNLVRLLAGQAARVLAAMGDAPMDDDEPPASEFVDLSDLL